MKEVYGNAWELFKTEYDILCITTNGFVKNNGECVMGRGIAKEATIRYPQLAYVLGERITQYGNHVSFYNTNATPTKMLAFFPVKHNWWEEADIELIKRSCQELTRATAPHHKVLLPRPGCGNGKLKWTDVKPIIAPLLNDNVHIVHWKEN